MKKFVEKCVRFLAGNENIDVVAMYLAMNKN